MSQMDQTNHQFSVTVSGATFMPDGDAIREFVKQFLAEQEADPALRERFELNPEKVLSERGLALDLQRVALASSGLSGSEELANSCIICTCCFTEFCDHLSIIICKGALTSVGHVVEPE